MISNVVDIVTCILIVVAGITAIASIGCFWTLVFTTFFGNVNLKKPNVPIVKDKNGK